MGYKEAFKASQKEKLARPLIPVLFKFEKEGETVVGKLISVTAAESAMGEGTYNLYTLDTDDGLIRFSLGRVADQNLTNLLRAGRVYAFTYQGKEDLSGGRRVNRFEVYEVPYTDVEVEPGKDVPF